MDPLKAGVALLVCLLLFWLIYRLTLRMVDLGIAAGHAEERRRLEAEAAADAEAERGRGE